MGGCMWVWGWGGVYLLTSLPVFFKSQNSITGHHQNGFIQLPPQSLTSRHHDQSKFSLF